MRNCWNILGDFVTESIKKTVRLASVKKESRYLISLGHRGQGCNWDAISSVVLWLYKKFHRYKGINSRLKGRSNLTIFVMFLISEISKERHVWFWRVPSPPPHPPLKCIGERSIWKLYSNLQRQNLLSCCFHRHYVMVQMYFWVSL